MTRNFRFSVFDFRLVAIVALLTLARFSLAQNPPAPRTTAQLLGDVGDALRAGDIPKASSLITALRNRGDYASHRPPVRLFLTTGDLHFAKGTKESQEIALQIYAMPVSIYGDALPAQDFGLMQLRRAQVFIRQARLDQAKSELSAIRQRPQGRRGFVYADLGDAELLLMANQPEAARDRLSGLIDADDPALAATAMFNLGRAYVQLKQNDEAVTTFRKLWNRYGESEMVKQAIFLVGQIYFDRGDFLEARKLYEACAVVGASMQTRVRPGDELIVKVYDANHYNRTRSTALSAVLTVPSGDKESLRLEKNPVNDQLYVGRIRTTLGAPSPGDGMLQLAGGDVIEIGYSSSERVFKIKVVDDGSINIDSVPMPDPAPRHTRSMVATSTPKAQRDDRPKIIAARQAGGSLNPGSPVYVQVVDADLDTSPKRDTVTAEVVATGGGKDHVVKVQLTETGEHTGVFVGSVPTASSGPTITASTEATGHPAAHAIDVDRNSPAPATGPTSRPGKGLTFWQAKSGDKTPFIEIDLHQSAALAKLVWGAGDDAFAGKNMPTEVTLTLKGDGPSRVIQLKDGMHQTGNVVELKGFMARTIRIDITKWNGDAPAVGQFVLTDTAGNQLLPSGIEEAAVQSAGVLQFNVGQTVFARYTDEVNETPGTPMVRTSRRLGARYYDATISLVIPAADRERAAAFRPAWRLDLGASPTLLLNDPDLDTTTEPDTARVEVFTESGTRQQLTLTETGPSTGAFAADLTLSTNPEAKNNPRVMYIGEGDLLWVKYLDEKNMKPGYRTFRYASFLENRPTEASWINLPAITTAAPPAPAVTDDTEPGTIPAAARIHAKLTLAISDPDLMCNASTGTTVKINALIGTAAQEIMLPCSGPGIASQTVELVLGDTQPQAEPRRIGDDGKTVSLTTDLTVTGDDILRVATVDARIPTADLARRGVATEEDLKNLKSDPGTPVIKLGDPNRRAVAAQEQRLAALRQEMGARMLGYAAERKLIEERRDLLIKRQTALAEKFPTTGPAAVGSPLEALRTTTLALSNQIDLLSARIARLKGLGAKEGPRPAPPASQPAPQPDPLLVPGQPFDITIDDPDITTATLDVRLRSVAGRLIEKMTVTAKRDAAGIFRASVPTKSSDDPEQKEALSIVGGGEVIVDYQDRAQAAPQNVERVGYVAMGSDAELIATNATYYGEVSKVRLGEPVYIQVTDYDADRSAGIDQIPVLAKTSSGDRMIIMLSETEPHSGVFRGKVFTDTEPAKPDDDVLQANYGGWVELTYLDHIRQSLDSPEKKVIRLEISGGADGAVEGFSRHFKDAAEEMKLWAKTGESAYLIGRRLYLAGAYERAEEYLVEAADYFTQLVSHFPNDPMAARANYYVGNIASLKGNHREALQRFLEVITRWPKSDFVARARFKVGSELEMMGRFDEAADAYVLLTYHHPADPNVPEAMIRMMKHFEREKQFDDAVAVAQKFVEKFPKHERAGAAAVMAGLWLTEAQRVGDAIAWFAQQEKDFAASDKDMPALLLGHSYALLQTAHGGRGGRPVGMVRPEKIKELLQRIIYDYPKSAYVNEARKMLEQVADPR